MMSVLQLLYLLCIRWIYLIELFKLSVVTLRHGHVRLLVSIRRRLDKSGDPLDVTRVHLYSTSIGLHSHGKHEIFVRSVKTLTIIEKVLL